MDKPCKISWRCKNKDGYAKTHIGGIHSLEHRDVYAKHYKIVLTSDQQVRHLCNNPGCIEITHLALGTNQDNVNDRVQAGRSFGVLSEDQVQEIRRKYALGVYLQKDLAAMFKVSPALISQIVTKRIWKHV